MNLNFAVDRTGFRSGRPSPAVLTSLRYSHETHPAGSDTHGCLTLHFAKNGNGKETKSLNSPLPTASSNLNFQFLSFRLARNLSFIFLLFTIHLSFFTCAYAVEPPKRIISLAPNLTEILFELGLGNRIIGVTTFCDYPEEAKKKPKVGGMSNPSLEAVVSMKPDIVLMTTDGNPKEFEPRLRSSGIKTYIFRARRLTELPQGIRDLGIALGIKERADKFANETEVAINALLRVTRHASQKKRILFIVWPEPLIVAGPGTVIDDAIHIIGSENIASRAKASYPKYSIEEVLRMSPDLIIIGKGHVDIRKASEGLINRLKILPAVKNNKVFYVSDDLYRLGPRTLRGVEEIGRLVEGIQ